MLIKKQTSTGSWCAASPSALPEGLWLLKVHCLVLAVLSMDLLLLPRKSRLFFPFFFFLD